MKVWDRDILGAFASFLCALHCALFPILLTLLPLLGLHLLLSRSFELGMLLTAGGIAAWSAFRGFRLHGRPLTMLLFACGILLLMLGFFFQHDEPVHSLSALGGFLLVIAHVQNNRQCRHPARAGSLS
ncbi:MAG: MerC domain-containing protein [Spirochaetales bacterium]|nr:MerC domain-containing protein [Spirochaetales bacterium]